MEEWKKYNIKDICESIFAGGDASKYNTSKTKTDIYNIPIYANAVENNGLYGYCDSPLVTEPAVTVAARGAGTGFVAYRDTPFVPIVRLITLIPKKNVNTYFLSYVLKYLNLRGDGSAIPQITVPQIKKEIIYLPSYETQNAIANIFSSLDDKIQINNKINENLEQQAQALFKSWFVDFEPFKDGKFVDSELGMIPESLKLLSISETPHKLEAGKRPKGGAVLSGVPSIGAENIKGLGHYDFSKTKYIPQDFADKTTKGKINGYELLIYKDGGKPGYFIPNYTVFGEGFPYEEMFINEHVFKLDLMDNGYNVFAYFYMQTPYIINQLNSIGGKAAIPGINTRNVESLPIFSNDNEYIKKFGIIVLPLIKKILFNCKENKCLSSIRDTLLPKLMSGEINVDDIE